MRRRSLRCISPMAAAVRREKRRAAGCRRLRDWSAPDDVGESRGFADAARRRERRLTLCREFPGRCAERRGLRTALAKDQLRWSYQAIEYSSNHHGRATSSATKLLTGANVVWISQTRRLHASRITHFRRHGSKLLFQTLLVARNRIWIRFQYAKLVAACLQCSRTSTVTKTSSSLEPHPWRQGRLHLIEPSNAFALPM
jgi:hypothetical protein